MKLSRTSFALMATLLAGTALPTFANATVTVLGWPGGSEETALRATVETYNKQASDADKVELLFFNREGFYDKLQADMAAGSSAFDVNLVATYSLGRYAPYMEPVDLGADAAKIFGESVLKTMQFDGKQYGVPTDLSLQLAEIFPGDFTIGLPGGVIPDQGVDEILAVVHEVR